MIEQKPSSIGEAPSLADIKSAGDRVGRVDFTARLGAEDHDTDGDSDHDAEHGADAQVVALTSRVHAARTPVDSETNDRSLPFILPPAKVDEAMAVEAARVRRAIAEARGETVGVEDDADELAPDEAEPTEDQEIDETIDEDLEEESVEGADVHAPRGRQDVDPHEVVRPAAVAIVQEPPLTGPSRRALRRRREEPSPTNISANASVSESGPEPAAARSASMGEGLMIQDVASLADIAAEATAVAAAQAAAAVQAEIEAGRARAESAAAAAAEVQAMAPPSAVAGPVRSRSSADLDDHLADHLVAGIDGTAERVQIDQPAPPVQVVQAAPPVQVVQAAPPVQSSEHVVGAPVVTEPAPVTAADVPVDQAVADVAARVISLMRDTQDAHLRHLESVELEAARHCELLTAQAELDAELIRLHARREAHAIISAAQMRTGVEPSTPLETDHLSEIGETFSRFAETIETTIAFGSASPDHPRMS